MKTIAIAVRNLARSRRRSATAMLVITASVVALLMFGGFVQNVTMGFGSNIVAWEGHFTLYQKGYSEYGMGKPQDYGIENYKEVERWLLADPFLKRHIKMMQPRVELGGLAGNAKADTSTNFFGYGSVPSLRKGFSKWDGYQLGPEYAVNADEGLRDWDVAGAAMGVKLAEALKLCEPEEKTERCPETQERLEPERGEDGGMTADGRPKVELLSGTSGAPNVVRMSVAKMVHYGDSTFDASHIAMHLKLAQRLMYGEAGTKVTGILVQLHTTEELPETKAYLVKKIAREKKDLEVKDLYEKWPIFVQVLTMFRSIFIFISFILAVVGLFSINNTMTMCVMERVSEIGTLRSLGLNRAGLRNLFLVEGALLGMLGATLGMILGVVIAASFNAGGFAWIPPTQTDYVPIKLQIFKQPWIIPATWLLMTVVSALSSYFPARRAGGLNVVDALRQN